jgi:hypothetical protein
MSAETGCECSALELHDGRCAGCGRSVLERVAVPGRPGADYEVLLGEVARLRAALSWIAEYGSREGDLREGHEDAMRHIAFNALAIDAVDCAPVESAARAVAPWCADHVRESEESRQPKDGAA